jgi:4-amino-4-deoxy-L-arabinose transferase-like glycosyltransferase
MNQDNEIGRFLKYAGIALVLLLLALRWVTYSVDFPPITGSVGEYIDMGWHFSALRSFSLTGEWNLGQPPVHYLSPVYYALVFVSLKVWGNSFFAYRFWSLFFSTLAIVGIGVYGWRAYGSKLAIGSATLLAIDAVWFAYARCEKAETVAATFLTTAAVFLGSERLPEKKRVFLSALFLALAFYSKPTVLYPAMGMVLCAVISDRSILRPRILAFAALGGVVATLAAASILAPSIFSTGNIQQLPQIIDFLKLNADAPLTWGAGVENLVASSAYLRSPTILFGIFFSLFALLNFKNKSTLAFALSGIVLGCVVAPIFKSYYPLRYRVFAIPAAALLTGLFLFGPWRKNLGGWRLSLASCFGVFFVAGFFAYRYRLQFPLLFTSAVALATGSIIHFKHRLLGVRILTVSALGLCLLIGAIQIASWQAYARYDLQETANQVKDILPSGSIVATRSLSGMMILLDTPYEQVDLSSPRATAYLLTTEPHENGIDERLSSIKLSQLILAYERRTWYGTTFFLYLRPPVAGSPEPPH